MYTVYITVLQNLLERMIFTITEVTQENRMSQSIANFSKNIAYSLNLSHLRPHVGRTSIARLILHHELMPIAQLNRITLHIILAPPDEVYMATYFTKPGP